MSDAPIQQQCAHPTQAICVRQWEADHQRTVLEHYGLAEELPDGCDAIEEVVTRLIEVRQERDELRLQLEDRKHLTTRLKCEIITPPAPESTAAAKGPDHE